MLIKKKNKAEQGKSDSAEKDEFLEAFGGLVGNISA